MSHDGPHAGGAVSLGGSGGAARLQGAPGKWLLHEDDVQCSKLGSVIAKNSPTLRRLEALIEREKRKDAHVAWINTKQANIFFSVVIVASAVLTGVDVDISVRGLELAEGLQVAILAFQTIFVLIFVLELGLHIRADGARYVYPCNPAGCLDTLIIAICVTELFVCFSGLRSSVLRASGTLRLFRLLRLMRFLKVLLIVKELRKIFVGFFSSFSSMFWSAVLMMILMYIGGLFCAILLADVDGPPDIEQYFGSIPMGLFSHFMVITLEEWPEISDSVMKATGHNLWAIYFISFILATSLALMNLMTGVICEKLVVATVDDEEDATSDQFAEYQHNVDKFRFQLERVFDEADINRYSGVDVEEFSELLEFPGMQQLLASSGVAMDMPKLELFEVLDINGDGQLTFNELLTALVRLTGSLRHSRSLVLQHDVATLHKRGTRRVVAFEESVSECISTDLARAGAQLVSSLQETDENVQRLSDALESRHKKASVDDSAAGLDPALALNLVTRFEDVIADLDRRCRCASDLLAASPCSARRPAAVSRETQTHATIDFIDGLAPSNQKALLAL